MPSAENCIACRFHQEIDQGAQNTLAFCPLKTRNTVQSKRLHLVDSLFIISDSFLFVKNFFKTFFRSFRSISFKTQTFLTAASFETAYLVYQTQNHLSRTFSFFSNLFGSTAAPLGDSFNRIPQRLPSCQHNFSIFVKILLNTKNAPLLPAIGVSGASAQFIFGKRSCSMTASRVMPAYAICARPSMKRETAATSTEMLSATNGMVFSSASEPSTRVLCLR